MNQNDDSMLDDYLDGKSSVSKIYQHSSKSQPPAALDEKILAQARQAIENPPDSDRKPGMMARRPRWLVPLSLAATLMLGINLAYHLKDYSPDTAYSEDAAVVMSPRIEARHQQAAETNTHTSSDADRPKPVSDLSRAIARIPPASPELEERLSRARKTGELKKYADIVGKRSEPGSEDTEPTQDELAYAPAPASATPRERVEMPQATVSPDQFDDAMPAANREIAAVTHEPAIARSRMSGNALETHDTSQKKEEQNENFSAAARTETPVFQCDLTSFGLSDPNLENRVHESRHNQATPAAWKTTIVRHAERGEYRQACLELAAFQQHYPDATLPADFPVQIND